MTTADRLKQRHRRIRDTQSDALRMRIHRALSWLARAERESDDPDACFLFLWIAFNAAYASEFGFEQSERDQSRRFIAALVACDAEQRLHHMLLEQFTGPIRTLIKNKYVFEPYWKALRTHDSSNQWEASFAASQRVALKAVLEKKAETVLSVVLDRLYVLRNQLVHGGATWRGSANRAQVKDGAHIMQALVPVIVELMMDSEAAEFGDIAFPLMTG